MSTHWLYQRRQWQTTPLLLPRKSHGQRSLVDCSPWGHYESDTTERVHFHFPLSTFTHCGRKWQPTPVFLPGEFHGQRSLVGYSPPGHKKSDSTEWLTLEKEKKKFTLFFSFIALTKEKAMAAHSSTLVWRIPWMEERGRQQSMGSRGVRHDGVTSLSLFTFLHWTRKWQPTPVFLPGDSQGRGSLVGCRLGGCTESDTTEAT